MKMKKKILIPIVAVAAVGVVAVAAVRQVSANPVAPIVDTYPVTKGELSHSVSVTGMVESGNTANVYTALTYQIQQVAVEVGDQVQEGDVLCTLDTAALESTIAQTQATLANAQAKANWNVAMAEKDLETAKYNNEEDYNTQLLQAKESLKSAEKSLEQRQNELLAAQHTANSARRDLRDLREDRKQTTDFSNTLTYDDVLSDLQQKSLQADISVEGSQLAVEAAENALEAARASLAALEAQTEQAEVTTEDAVTTAQLNADLSDQYIALQKLQNDLAEATIRAPISGIVTAVYAKEGASGAGMLFVIEDPDDLKVTTKIKEYDIASVDTGMPVTIKADGTGNEEYEGVLSKIAPTTLKDATGNTVDTTSAEFEAEVKVTSRSQLRIGMNTRLNIITQQKSDVLSVPIESVTTDEDGNDSLFIVVQQEDGTHTAKRVSVTVGMETDFSCEVTSGELQEGDEVILSPAGMEDGMLVTRLDQEAIGQAMLA